ncbi:MAG: ShlB/FhaC/HecB family hemolysin secretion/activation protein [Candidatus Omnitrophica bacterium]|nr:ShlB/FhaC/HecB family hemolysin secretion/activation protein [Candidatus Omnitrophota bacterium]
MKSEKCFFAGFLFLILGFLSVSLTYAADIPSRDTGGAEQDRFEKNQKLEKRVRNIDEANPPKEVPLEDQQKMTLPAEGSQVHFLLKEVHITGNETIARSEFDRVILGYVGQEVGFRELKELGTKIKNIYREKGFIAAYVYMPPQDVTSGRVEFAVAEGKLGKVNILGNKWFSTSILKRMLRLSSGAVISYKDLKRGLAFLNENQDIKAKAVLKPGAEIKTSDLDIEVQDKMTAHITADVNNLGTANTGKNRWGISMVDTNFLGLMDQLSTRFELGSRSWSLGTGYTIPLTSFGTSLGFNYSHSKVDVGGPFKDLQVEGRANTYGIDLTQKVFRETVNDSVYVEGDLNIGFDFKSIENKVLGSKAGHDELRILNTGVNLEEADNFGKTYFPHSFHFGFSDFLGASGNIDSSSIRRGTGGQFFIYRGSLARYLRLPYDLVYAFRSSWQFTPDNLPSSEELRMGGAFSVRGYPEGDYLSDNGAYASNEIYIPTYFFPKNWKLPFSSEPLRRQIQGVTFIDFGGGTLRNTLAGEEKNKFLIGAGGGLRIHLFDRIYGRFQWAGRLGAQDASDNSSSAFYYGVSAEML